MTNTLLLSFVSFSDLFNTLNNILYMRDARK